ncbi:MAG: hypothetical protein ACYC7D_07445 [Nitrososphaerales archaeon]
MAAPETRARRHQSPLVRGSYEELLRFVRYYRHFGTPTIIGGWAVYFYNPYYGSVDIDVVGQSFRGSYDVIERYERSHGYTIAQNDPLGIEVVASKPIYKSKKKIGDMEIDACSYEQRGASSFHEDEKKRLPYSLCNREEHRKEVAMKRDCICYVPCRALLTLFKVKARRDRSFDLRSKGASMNLSRLEWLRGKVVKDGSDIISLLDDKGGRAILSDEMDLGQMKRISSSHKITDMVVETLKEVLMDKNALSLYNRAVNRKTLLNSVEKLG